MPHVVMVHYVGATAQSRSVSASVALDHRKAGNTVTIADISQFTTISQDLAPAWAARLFGQRVHVGKFEKEMSDNDIRIETLRPQINQPAPLPPEIRDESAQAVKSELLTYFRTEKLNWRNPYLRWLHAKLSSAAVQTYFALSSLIESEKPDLVLIPNGRTSRQKVARKLAERKKLPFMFYEMGRAKRDSYYLGTTQPHDRIASQREIDSLTATLSREEIESLGNAMISERMTLGSSVNKYSKRWTAQTAQDEILTSENKTAVFFTSSTDEFLAFGPMWNIDSWTEQFESFDLLMSDLEDRGVQCTLRVHPNLLGKSHSYVSKTIASAKALGERHPELRIIWHTSPVNSYDLVRESAYVITEHSTIGLESSLMGKPVWVTEAAQWDQVADVRQVLGPEEFHGNTMELWDVNPLGAQKFAAYWMMQEHPLLYSWSDWASWNPSKPPFVMKVAQLLGKNPLRHKMHLLALEWDRVRNSLSGN